MIEINLLSGTDSYKIGHWKQYPPGTEHIYSYLESRGGEFPSTVFFGLQYYLKKYFEGSVITSSDIVAANDMCLKHFGSEMFNIDGWARLLIKHGGKLPISIHALPEGTISPIHTPLMTVENTDPEFPWLTNWLETLLSQLWYPITVATQSYYMKKDLQRALEISGTPALIDFQLHDFGFRGVSSYETASIGGVAHLTSFLGTDNMAALTMAKKYYKSDCAGFSIPACYDKETDILTGRGWTRFKDLTETDVVAQYEENGEISFVNPIAIHSYPHNGDMIKFSTQTTTAAIDLVVTPNHRMIRKSISTGEIEVQTADISTFSGKNRWLQGRTAPISGEGLSDFERLLIAFQADGSYPSRKSAYNGAYTNKIPIRFHLKKTRKVERLTGILDNIGCEYTKVKYDNGYYSFWVKLDNEIPKTFSWVDISKISSKWCAEFIDEVSMWDGTNIYDSVIYSSIIKDNVEVVQACAILAGYRASTNNYIDKRIDYDRKVLHNVNIAKSTSSRIGVGIIKDVVKYSGTVYCVTVPSGMIVVRRNGYVSISGNSEHSTITSWGKEHEVDAFRNMLQQYPTGLVACVSDSYDIYNACEHLWGEELHDEVMARDGTLICRPDSGDPLKVIPRCLNILGDKFGYTTNDKEFKILDSHVRMIQGDGINRRSMPLILETIMQAGWSADNIAFGSGGALLQQLNRDTNQFAFKCSSATVNGIERDVYKSPINSVAKESKRGRFEGLTEVFRDGEILVEYTLDEIRERIKSQ